jgi:hypothetical protein
MSLVGFSGFLGRYLSGLCVATLGLGAAGWLALAPVAFGYRKAGPHDAALTDWATGAGLAVVSLVTLVFWIVAWRRKLRADGILVRSSRGQARREARAQRRREHAGQAAARTPDPAQVLSELRALLIPLLAEPPNGPTPNGPTLNGPTLNGPTPNGQGLLEDPGEPDGDWPDRDYDEPSDKTSSAEPDHYKSDGDQPAAAEPGEQQPALAGPAVPAARSGGLAAMESMLAGAELLVVGCGEEEAWRAGSRWPGWRSSSRPGPG